jgi:hypothetical protein
MSALPEGCPPCGVMGCTRPQKTHSHTGVFVADERVVVVPKTLGAPGFAFTEPHGTVVFRVGPRYIVRLDRNGVEVDVHVDNLVRERLYQPPRPVAPHYGLPGKTQRLIDGPWEELTFDD